jgi:hypothetical protein
VLILEVVPRPVFAAGSSGTVPGTPYGRLAQLGERCVRNAEVRSSILLPSTNPFLRNPLSSRAISNLFPSIWVIHPAVYMTSGAVRGTSSVWHEPSGHVSGPSRTLPGSSRPQEVTSGTAPAASVSVFIARASVSSLRGPSWWAPQLRRRSQRRPEAGSGRCHGTSRGWKWPPGTLAGTTLTLAAAIGSLVALTDWMYTATRGLAAAIGGAGGVSRSAVPGFAVAGRLRPTELSPRRTVRFSTEGNVRC